MGEMLPDFVSESLGTGKLEGQVASGPFPRVQGPRSPRGRLRRLRLPTRLTEHPATSKGPSAGSRPSLRPICANALQEQQRSA